MSKFVYKFVFAGLLISGAGIILGIYFEMGMLVAWCTVLAWFFGVFSFVAFFIVLVIGCLRRTVSVFSRLLIINFIISSIGVFMVVFFKIQ